MAKQSLTVTLRIDGVRETLRVLSLLPREANNELRRSSLRLASTVATAAKTAAQQEGAQAAAVAKTVKARRDRVPVAVAGGTRRVGRKRAPAYALLFGSEFGMNRRTGWYAAPRYRRSTGRQYKPHRGRASYWFFRTAEEHEATISREWRRAADAVIDTWTRGGA